MKAAPADQQPVHPAQLRIGVAQAIRAVAIESRTIDWVLDNHPEYVPSAAARDMLYGTIRYYFSLSSTLLRMLEKPLKPRDFDAFALMLVGAYQLTHTNAKPYAVVSEAVNAVERMGKPWAKGLINRLLRDFRVPKRSFDHPDWLVAAIRDQYATIAHELLFANNTRAPMALRVNCARTSPAGYHATLTTAGIDAVAGAVPGSLVLSSPCAARSLPGWADGLVAVQDMGAQQVAHLCWQLIRERSAGNPAVRILDACAAPGGKLSHLLEQLQAQAPDNLEAEVWALELSAARLDETRRILQRLGHDPLLVQGDAARLDWWDGNGFDFVLLDAPCSGTGTIRRHPDVKLLVEESAIPAHARQQHAMLNNLWHTLAPGGTLLYCTCSLLQEENDNVVERFTMQTDAEVVPLTAFTGTSTKFGWQTLPTDPHTDGFYCAALRRPDGGSR